MRVYNNANAKVIYRWKTRNEGEGQIGWWGYLGLVGALGPSVLSVAQSGDQDEEDDRPRL
jgi:hypothetical protein